MSRTFNVAVVGATGAFLDWVQHRMRRQVGGGATRLANADAANVRRAVEAAGAQVRTIERVLDEVGWDGLPPELQEVALARLANPAASLAELGELCEPPITKSAVHRRLLRIRGLVADDHDPDSGDPRRFD
jgi:cell division protein WhiA